MNTYELGEQYGQRFILCRVCKMKSFNATDIAQRYCGNCHDFHDHMEHQRIWITQWLCPKRHCSIALVWHPRETTARAVTERGEAMYKSGALNRWCGLCRGELTPEPMPTRWRTMAEAEREGRKLEAANLASRALIDELAEKSRN